MKHIVLCCSLLVGPVFAGDDAYKDSQGYKDYLKLPASYRSPEAEALFRDSYEAEEKVKNLAAADGGTVGEVLDQKAGSPAIEDMGWITSPYQGGFIVERMLLMGERKMVYRWEVGTDGIPRAVNGKAIGVTRATGG